MTTTIGKYIVETICCGSQFTTIAYGHDKLAAPDTPPRRAYHPAMTTYFVSRHPGAVAWAASQSFHVDALVSHLDLTQVHPGDTVIGTLPVNLAAQVCAQGAAYWHLSLDLPAELRGLELSAANLTQLGAHVKHYFVEPIEPVTPN